MKKVHRLIRLANILSHKYASIDAETLRPEVESSIRTAIINASEQPSSGIMPFARMAQEDGVSVSFYVMRDGKNTKVYDLRLEPQNGTLLSKYQPLMSQVQDYLNKNWELYPTKKDGEDITYKGFTIRVVYPTTDTAGTA